MIKSSIMRRSFFREMDQGLAEALATIMWSTPRLQAEVPELKVVSKHLSSKYGKEWAQACLSNSDSHVNEKVMLRLGVQAPPKSLVERYMVEIAKSYKVDFLPDASMLGDVSEQTLIFTSLFTKHCPTLISGRTSLGRSHYANGQSVWRRLRRTGSNGRRRPSANWF